MISRLSAFAATFAVIAAATIAFAAATIAFAASAHQARLDNAAAAKAMPVVQFETVVVTGHRTAIAEQK
jgi:hypothetical protein